MTLGSWVHRFRKEVQAFRTLQSLEPAEYYIVRFFGSFEEAGTTLYLNLPMVVICKGWVRTRSGLASSHFEKPSSSAGEDMNKDSIGTDTYGPPEFHRCNYIPVKATERNLQAVDIWSLGCVYSGAAVWSQLGDSGLNTYRNSRLDERSKTGSPDKDSPFHNGQDVLIAVEAVHALTQSPKRPWDTITDRVIPVVKGKKCSPHNRMLDLPRVKYGPTLFGS
ncbi:hypothetical protein K469DRAFT_694833 [Zopfia rhizophila CBS 207.26]|uniref:Protein kinase domain-containing protein n=1 Tax=Zopfia rhizophila CBS 207.26 TaxID=1314779 RepID=A0A6A6EPT3_9PEZI|nr:hypothetical protein K469DRAFT_694833 [Zopfia rhizophila CBS 207.26]